MVVEHPLWVCRWCAFELFWVEGAGDVAAAVRDALKLRRREMGASLGVGSSRAEILPAHTMFTDARRLHTFLKSVGHGIREPNDRSQETAHQHGQ